MANELYTYENEVWRDIPSWPGYQASSHGRIRSIKRNLKTEKIMTPRSDPRTGYLRIALRTFRKRKTVKVHRLVCEAFHGPSPEGRPEVAHGDGTRTNNYYMNLRWASHRENVADQIAHGTFKRPPPPKGKLTSEQRQEIVKLRAGGQSAAALAEQFGVNRSTIDRLFSKEW